jgi:uncharacterized protein YecT (DUF1311 family)
MRVSTTALLLGFLFAGPVFADEQYDACVTSTDEAQCGDKWVAREQLRLDEAWRQLTEVADGDVATALQSEQKAWTEFSRLACLFKKDAGFGGAGGPTGYHACLTKVIADRTEALRGYTSYIDN